MIRKVQFNVVKEIKNSIELEEDKEEFEEIFFEEKANNSKNSDDDLLNDVIDEDNEITDSIKENENKENIIINLSVLTIKENY